MVSGSSALGGQPESTAAIRAALETTSGFVIPGPSTTTNLPAGPGDRSQLPNVAGALNGVAGERDRGRRVSAAAAAMRDTGSNRQLDKERLGLDIVGGGIEGDLRETTMLMGLEGIEGDAKSEFVVTEVFRWSLNSLG